MTANDAVMLLWKATLATSAASLLLLLLPPLLRRRFGAGVAYAAWILLPIALAASCLPQRDRAPSARTQEVSVRLPARMVAVRDMMARAVAVPTKAPLRSAMWRPRLLALWACGVLATGLWLWRRQRRFERGLGRLTRGDDGLWRSPSRIGLPALLGVAPARIVLPADFETRYEARERMLMLAHERAHARRGDHIANLAAACLRATFWFNPLVLIALARFRHDQELACDQVVLLSHPDSRRAYGEAMLKTLMADRLAPLGCHWGSSHSMKDRLMQLKEDIPRSGVRWIGASMVGALALCTGLAVRGAQPAGDASPVATAAAGAADNDGVFITLRVSPGRDIVPDQTVWLKPGQRVPAGLTWQDGTGSRTGVWMLYGVERDADGRMTALISLVEKDRPEPGFRPSMAGAPTIRVPAGADHDARFDRAVGRAGSRLVFEVRRAPGPCRGAVGSRSSDTAVFDCYPGLKPLTADAMAQDTLTPTPVYPPEALKAHVDGAVTLEFLVARDGSVKDARVVASSPAGVFDAAALQAVRRWHVKPRYENGVAVEEWRQAPMTFKSGD